MAARTMLMRGASVPNMANMQCKACGQWKVVPAGQNYCCSGCAYRAGDFMSTVSDYCDARIFPEPNSGCWLWSGPLFNTGYGAILHAAKNGQLAHRVVYERERGPIPTGLQIDHLCRVRCCVNPDHLEPVTQQENIRRGLAGQASGLQQSSKTECVRGHVFSADNTYVRPDGVRICRACQKIRKREYLDRKKVRLQCA